MDFQSLLLDPNYTIWGVDAILNVGSVEYSLTAIDKTSGVDTGDTVHGQSILPAAVVRATEFLALGLAFSDLSNAATITLNGFTWNVETYRMKPTPNGENDGEIYLILTAPTGIV